MSELGCGEFRNLLIVQRVQVNLDLFFLVLALDLADGLVGVGLVRQLFRTHSSLDFSIACSFFLLLILLEEALVDHHVTRYSILCNTSYTLIKDGVFALS